MTIDIEAVLRRVVADVFDADVAVDFDAGYAMKPQNRGSYRVRLTDPTGERHAGLQASSEWFEATVLDLRVSAILLEYDGDEQDKEAILRALAVVLRAYLRGEGRIEHKRFLFRSLPVLKIQIDDREWTLRRRSSQVHYPE